MCFAHSDFFSHIPEAGPWTHEVIARVSAPVALPVFVTLDGTLCMTLFYMFTTFLATPIFVLNNPCYTTEWDYSGLGFIGDFSVTSVTM